MTHSSGWPTRGSSFEQRMHNLCEHSHIRTLDCECQGCNRLIEAVRAEVFRVLDRTMKTLMKRAVQP